MRRLYPGKQGKIAGMLKALLKTMRPRQWTKNIFIFAALVFDKQLFAPDSFLRTWPVLPCSA
jgi:hypothetical protein